MEKFGGFSTASGKNVLLKPELVGEMENKYRIILDTDAEYDQLLDSELTFRRNNNKRKNPSSTRDYASSNLRVQSTSVVGVHKRSKMLPHSEPNAEESIPRPNKRINCNLRNNMEKNPADADPLSDNLKLSCVAFQTASGKMLQIRPESVKLARKIISDSFGSECGEDGGENSPIMNNKDANFAKRTEEKGRNVVTYASGYLKPNENCLKRMHHFEGQSFDTNAKTEECAASFRTARGKMVETRHDSLVLAENILRDTSALEFPDNGNSFITNTNTNPNLSEVSLTEANYNVEEKAYVSVSISLDQEIADSTLALLYDIKNNEDDSFSVEGKTDFHVKPPSTAVPFPNQEIEGVGGGGGGGSSSSPILKGKFDKAKITRKSRVHVRKLVCGSSKKWKTIPAGNLENSGANTAIPSNSYGKCDFEDESNFAEDIIVASLRERAAIKQQDYIMNKPDKDCRPRAGFYMSQFQKSNPGCRMTLRRAFPNQNPKRYSPSEVSLFCSCSILYITFFFFI